MTRISGMPPEGLREFTLRLRDGSIVAVQADSALAAEYNFDFGRGNVVEVVDSWACGCVDHDEWPDGATGISSDDFSG